MEQQSNSDTTQLAEFGYKQELHRTLGSFSSFAAGFSYISILTGMFQTSYLGFLFAGPAFIWAWIFVLAGQFMVALQFAELSAHFPLAGSIYQWSKQVAGKSWAWNTGWMYLWAQIVTVPAVALGWQVILPQVSHRFVFVGTYQDNLDYTNPNFAKNAIILGIILIGLTTLINMAGVAIMSKINNVGVIAELIGAGGLILIFLFHANRSPSTVLTDTAGTGAGHSWGYLGALLIGAIMPLYVMYGFDTAGSLAEETDDPQRRAPRAVLQALATAGTMGFLLILFGTMAVSDAGYKNITSIGGLAGITTDVLGTTWGKVFLVDVAIAIFVCCLAIHAMSVRILFAMGRDNNLPAASALASVSGTRRVPVVPAVFVGVVSVLILAFNWLNPYAFTIVISCGIVFMYLAYLGVTVPLMQRRMNGWPQNAPTGRRLFSLGSYGKLTNVIAIAYGLAMSVNLCWPRVEFYGSKWYQEYGVMTAVAVVVLSGLALYYGYQESRTGVLAEHRADTTASLSAAMNEPPPIHGGP